MSELKSLPQAQTFNEELSIDIRYVYNNCNNIKKALNINWNIKCKKWRWKQI